MVEGSLVGLFDASSGLPQFSSDFSESKVQVVRVDGIGELSPAPTGEVSATNTFRIEDVPVGNAWVTVSGPNHLTREMRWGIREGTNTFEQIDLVNDPDFPSLEFGRMFRWTTGVIGRWVEPARVVVVSPNISYDDVVTATIELANMTRSRFVASVEARPPTFDEREALDEGCDYHSGSTTAANGKIFVGQGLIDEARICFDQGPDNQPEITWALVRIKNDPVSIRHGLGHGAGAWHPCGVDHHPPHPLSLMSGRCTPCCNTPPSAPSWTVFDKQAFLFAYSRPPGTGSEDDSKRVELMLGTVSATDAGMGTSSSASPPETTTPPDDGHQAGLESRSIER